MQRGSSTCRSRYLLRLSICGLFVQTPAKEGVQTNRRTPARIPAHIHTNDHAKAETRGHFLRPVLPQCSRFSFVHIPKTGGTSVITAFAKLKMLSLNLTARDHHSPARVQRVVCASRTLHPCHWEGAVTFAVVRNPFTLIVSMFFWMAQLCVHREVNCNLISREHAKIVNSPKASLRSVKSLFNRWLDKQDRLLPPNGPGFLSNSLLQCQILINGTCHGSLQLGKNTTQSAWVTDATGKVLVSQIVKLESRDFALWSTEQGLLQILCNHGKNSLVGLKAPRSNPTQHVAPSAYHTKLTCAIVRRRFVEDFIRFGYDPSDCTR